MGNFKIGKKAKAIIVITFVAIYAIVTYILLRGQYLEYLELGQQYVEVFFTNLKYANTATAITTAITTAIIASIILNLVFIFTPPKFPNNISLYFQP